MNHSTKILAFSGSVRKESLNQKFLEEMVKAVRTAGGDVNLEEAEGLPANARKLIDLIKGHAGLLIASPEYNSMNTPLLKNTLDWCTRDDDNNPFPGRVAAVISASPGALGGIRSLKLAQQLLLHLGCQVVPGNVMLPHAHKAFGTDGKLTDARSLKALNELAAALVRTAQKLGQ
jgi:NAD(P)H-dependent FMN reductase